MTTLEFVSTSADGLAEGDTPLVSAAALIAGLGTHPTVTIPVVAGCAPETAALWHWLAEPAEFFGAALPGEAQLRRVLADFAAELRRRHGPVTAAVTVQVVQGQFLVTGSPITPQRPEPVSLTTCAAEAAVPYWRQMAARTASRAAELAAQRELTAAGHADAVPAGGDRIGAPVLGALLCETPGGRIGLGADRLDRLREAGLLPPVTVTDQPIDLATVTRAWWVSPVFETHPVSAIGECRL